MAADGYGDGLDDAEREAIWLAAGVATFIGQAIADVGGGGAPPVAGPHLVADGRYGVGSGYEPPKMSELPKLAGQSCCGAGFGTDPPVWSDIRQASIAGHSAARRASFQTAAPYVLVATA